jgi:small subunit ribosomal protein S8
MYTRLLTEIKNAQAVGKERIKTPYSKMDEKILEILSTNKFIAGFEKKGKNPKRYLEVLLLYKNGTPAIRGIKFVSTPSRHIYRKYSFLRPVKQGFGIAVISTSKGLMTDKEAVKNKIGGEVLFNIW